MADKREFDKDINYPKVLFRHIDRILTTTVAGDRPFISGVEGLQDALSPFLDDAEIEIPAEGDTSGLVARKKLRAAMKKMDEKGLLIDKVSDDETWTLPEDEDIKEEPKTN